jgi:hypothetical protein
MYSRRKCLTVEETIAEIYSNPLSDISNSESSDTEMVDSHLPKKSAWESSQSCLGGSSDSEPSNTDSSDSETSEQSDTETVDGWTICDNTPNTEGFLGNPGVNVNIENPTNIAQVVSTVTGDDLVELFAEQSNSFHRQNVDKCKMSPKSLKRTDITKSEMKKFLGLTLLMGQVRKDNLKDYWSTDPAIATPVFSQTMSRNRFEAIWQAWHFNDNSQLQTDSSTLFKTETLYEYLLQKFRSMYSPEQELSLDVGMIPWRGRLRFRNYNPGKITKYGISVRMLCEATTGYISNTEIYTAQGKKLNDTVMSVLENNLGVHHHVYQENFYNSLNLVGNLLKHKIRVCGTMRPNRSILKDLEKEAKELKTGQSSFRKKVIYWCKFGKTRD